ncbi:MAG: transposase [Nitrososphaeria archaeon]
MANFLDEALREIYKETIGRDPLAFMNDAIDWNAFPPLLEDLYRNNTDTEGAPNIPIVIMVKAFFLRSIYNTSDETTEREIHE